MGKENRGLRVYNRRSVKSFEYEARSYVKRRKTDATIGNSVAEALRPARRIVNVGAGGGSYEPTAVDCVAVDSSARMLREHRGRRRVIACAEALPFRDQEFDAATVILSVHHWEDPERGLSELARVANRQILLTFFGEESQAFWLKSDYLPEIDSFAMRGPRLAQIQAVLGPCMVSSISIPFDCGDGFLVAYWRRPEMYLVPEVQMSSSSLARIPQEVRNRAFRALANDLESGRWYEKYGWLLDRTEMDFGLRLLVAGG